MTTAKLFAGASGYSFKEWKGVFYPDDIKAEDMLPFYSARLPTVEINNTFYRMPKTSVIENWAAATPEDFGSRSKRRNGSRTCRACARKRRPSRSAICTRTWLRCAPSEDRCCSSCRPT
jgi:hypothetical protein